MACRERHVFSPRRDASPEWKGGLVVRVFPGAKKYIQRPITILLNASRGRNISGSENEARTNMAGYANRMKARTYVRTDRAVVDRIA